MELECPKIDFSVIDYMNNENLNILLENEEALLKLVQENPFIKPLQENKNEAIITNRSLSEYNLSREPRIEGLKHVLAVAYERANDYCNRVQQNRNKLDQLSNKYSLDVILALLQTETAENDEMCEEMNAKFLSGDKNADDFLEDYIFIRQKYYNKKIKADKLNEIMTNKLKPAPPPPSRVADRSSNPMPYPSVSNNMYPNFPKYPDYNS